MVVAIYARKSTEQTGVADHEKSVTGQIDHATDYAAGGSTGTGVTAHAGDSRPGDRTISDNTRL